MFVDFLAELLGVAALRAYRIEERITLVYAPAQRLALLELHLALLQVWRSVGLGGNVLLFAESLRAFGASAPGHARPTAVSVARAMGATSARRRALLNDLRPHKSLGNRTPEEFVRELQEQPCIFGLASFGATGFNLVSAAIRSFRQAHPEFSIKLAHFMIAHHADALRIGSVDIALTTGAVEADGLRVDHLHALHLIAALPEGHPLTKQLAVSASDLAGEPFLEFPRYGPTGLHDIIRSFFARESVIPNVVQEIEGHDRLIAGVAAGLGVAIVNETGRYVPISGIVYKDLAPESPTINLVALSRSGDDNPFVAAFIEHLKTLAAQGV